MRRNWAREKLTGEILRSSYEAVDLADMGSHIMPLLERLLDTSTSLLYRCDESHQIVPICGDMTESIPFYSKNYFAIDPLQRTLLSQNPSMLEGSRMKNWTEYLSSAAYQECATRQGIDNFIHLRLSDCGMYAPGMVGVMVARTFGQPDFDDEDRNALKSLKPALESVVRRSARLEERFKAMPFLETLLEAHEKPAVVLDPCGRFLWASERADALLNISSGRRSVPSALEEAAGRLGSLIGKNPKPACPPASVLVPVAGSRALPADLRLVRTRGGAYFVVVELNDSERPPTLAETAARFRLTKTETEVLHQISRGFSDREIGRQLFISEATVHTHVKRILEKLDVGSRTQAALIALGRKPG